MLSGGDSAIRHEGCGFKLCPDRVIPLSLLAKRHPSIKNELRALLASSPGHTKPLHEYYTLVRDIENKPGWTYGERAFCKALKARNKPLSLKEAAEAAGTDIYKLDLGRLEAEGAVLRAGLTPTDIMHIRGDFAAYDAEAAELGASFVLRCMGRDDAEPAELKLFCEEVYDRVKKTLYQNIVRILLQDKYPRLRKDGPGAQLYELIASSWLDCSRLMSSV